MPYKREISSHGSSEIVPLTTPAGSTSAGRADEICNELMDHVFTCTLCINDLEDSCPTFRTLRQQIAEAGGPVKSALLTI